MTTSELSAALMSECFAIFGFPSRISSDNDVLFAAALWKDLMKRGGIEHLTTTIHRPQANGKAERNIRSAKEALIATMQSDEAPEDWKQAVKPLQLGLNTAVRKASGRSAAEELFGFQIGGAIEYAYLPLASGGSVEADRLTKLKEDFMKRFERQKKAYDSARREEKSFADDELVLVRAAAVGDPPSGLEPHFIGPYHVVEDAGLNVVIRISGKNREVHKENVKRFTGIDDGK